MANKSDFDKKRLQRGVDKYIKQKGAEEHFRGQVHENNISKNEEFPKHCMAGIDPEIDNEARNIAKQFGWVKSRRFDVMTVKYASLLKLFNVKIAQRPKDEDNQSKRFCRIKKRKRELCNWWYIKGLFKGAETERNTVKKVMEILELDFDQEQAM